MGSKRGQVLVELLFALPLLLCLSGLALDLIRSAQFHMVFHHVACLAARHKALGRAGSADLFSRQQLAPFFGKRFAEKGGLQITEIVPEPGTQRSRTILLHYRYPQFFRFPLGNESKHHMEVSARCSFPIG